MPAERTPGRRPTPPGCGNYRETCVDIHYQCRGCGKAIRKAVAKIGVPVECGRCGKVGSVPGMARQTRATAEQLARIVRCAKHLRFLGRALLCCALVFAIGVAMGMVAEFASPGHPQPETMSSPAPTVTVLSSTFVGAVAFLLFFGTCHHARQLLTGSGVALLFTPLFIALVIPTYAEIQQRAKSLTQAGPRE